jgi:hypothetical protein
MSSEQVQVEQRHIDFVEQFGETWLEGSTSAKTVLLARLVQFERDLLARHRIASTLPAGEGISDLIERIKKVRSGELTGVPCEHGWDTSVCPMRGCGDDEDDLIEHLLDALSAKSTDMQGEVVRDDRTLSTELLEAANILEANGDLDLRDACHEASSRVSLPRSSDQGGMSLDGVREALENIQLHACNHGGWVENDPMKGVSTIHDWATEALEIITKATPSGLSGEGVSEGARIETSSKITLTDVAGDALDLMAEASRQDGLPLRDWVAVRMREAAERALTPSFKVEGERLRDADEETIARVLFDQRQTKHDFDEAADADPESDAGTLRSICFDDARAVIAALSQEKVA